MTRRGTTIFAASAALTLLVAVGGTAATAAPKAPAKPPIVLGVDMALTGPLAVLGTAYKDGIVLAARQINTKGGINGRKIALTILDDASSPTQAVTNVTRLISQGVVALLGPNAGPLAAATTPLAVRSNVLQFVGSASDVAGTAHGPTVFFMPAKLTTWADAMACYLKKSTKVTRVAAISSTDPAGIGEAQAFNDSARKYGLQIVARETVDLTATDTSVQWTKIRGERPEAIAHMVTGSLGGLTIKTARGLGVTQPIVGWVAWGQPAVLRLAGDSADGSVIAGVFSGTDPAPQQRLLAKTYLRNHGSAPDMYNALGYDMMNLAALALKQVKNPTQKSGRALARALEGKPIKGGVLTYNFTRFDPKKPDGNAHDGIRVPDVTFLKIRGGQFYRDLKPPKCP